MSQSDGPNPDYWTNNVLKIVLPLSCTVCEGRRGLLCLTSLVIKPPLAMASAPLRIGFVHRFVRLSVCLFVCRQNAYRNAIFSKKLSSLKLWSLLTTYIGFFKVTRYWIPKIQDGGRSQIVFAIAQQPTPRFQWNFARRSTFSQNFGNGTDTRVA